LSAVTTIGPPRLVEEADRIIEDAPTAIDAMLLAGWYSPAGQQFFPKIALQPYAQCLRTIDAPPIDRDIPRGRYSCPFCGGAPQLSILERAGDADGGSRQLFCGTCFTVWRCPRVRCPQCGEDDERRLGYYHSPAFEHLRVDACDTCNHYLKTVDLTRLGIAVPVVDEVAAATLDLWAREHNYQKIELNLVGL
jgi:formate dehydrogenase accessory protein FdhE